MIFTWNFAVNGASMKYVPVATTLFRYLAAIFCIKTNKTTASALIDFIYFVFIFSILFQFYSNSKSLETVKNNNQFMIHLNLLAAWRHDERYRQTQSCSRWESVVWCHVLNSQYIVSCRISWPLFRWGRPIHPANEPIIWIDLSKQMYSPKFWNLINSPPVCTYLLDASYLAA